MIPNSVICTKNYYTERSKLSGDELLNRNWNKNIYCKKDSYLKVLCDHEKTNFGFKS